MRRTTALMIAAGVLASGLLMPTGGALAQRRGGGNREKIAFSDEAVSKAIEKGVEFLKSQMKEDGSFGPYGNPGGGHFYPAGPSAMAVYAMLEAGVSYKDPVAKKALDFLEGVQAPDPLRDTKVKKVTDAYKKNWQKYSHMTYSLGLRANAWLAAVKQGGRMYRDNLRADASQLIRATRDGSYNYTSYGQLDSHNGDNSNSQYGVLGVWAAAQADEEVPRQYWYLIMKHWLECVCSDGGWAYRSGRESTATMTTAGLATLFVCYDNLLADGFVKCDLGPKADAVLRPLTRALDWMDRYFEVMMKGQKTGYGDSFYLLYGIERVGLASGYKYFGDADWYRLGATKLINSQNANGSWKGKRTPVVSTSYALLFLVRGRHAVLFNKLEFPGDWNNRPRDLASLCRWTSKQFETTVNWQIVNLHVPPDEWHDAPILYISGSKAPQFTETHIEALRTYVNQGGTILSCTECEGAEFNTAIRSVYKQLFPDYPLTPVPKDHEFYTINFKLEGFPDFQMIHNGIRPLVIHTDEDLPKDWQLQRTQTGKQSFQAPTNVAMYMTGKGLAEKDLAARGTRVWPAPVSDDFKPERVVKVARLKYNTNEGKPGNYDAEPLAWQRFRRLMATRDKTRVDVAGPVDIAELGGLDANLAVLTGTDQMALSADEVSALTKFITDGGLLILEAAGGAKPFAEAAETAARQIADALPAERLPTKRLRRLTNTAPIYQQEGAKLGEISFRRYTRVKLQIRERTPRLEALLDSQSQPLILFSDCDISSGLVGYSCYEVHGYEPESSFDIMRCVVRSKAKELPKPKEDAKKSGDGK